MRFFCNFSVSPNEEENISANEYIIFTRSFLINSPFYLLSFVQDMLVSFVEFLNKTLNCIYYNNENLIKENERHTHTIYLEKELLCHY